jgi:hypothetical protein
MKSGENERWRLGECEKKKRELIKIHNMFNK